VTKHVSVITLITSCPLPVNRRNLVANIQSLIRATRGRRILFSSGAVSALQVCSNHSILTLIIPTALPNNPISLTNPLLQMRAPRDVINLANMFGFSPTEAKESVTCTALKALLKGESRRTTKQVLRVFAKPLNEEEEAVLPLGPTGTDTGLTKKRGNSDTKKNAARGDGKRRKL